MAALCRDAATRPGEERQRAGRDGGDGFFSRGLNTDEARILTGKTTQKFFTHFSFDCSVMSFAVMIRAKCSNILFGIESIFAQWNYMVSFEINFSICHDEAGFFAPFAFAISS